LAACAFAFRTRGTCRSTTFTTSCPERGARNLYRRRYADLLETDLDGVRTWMLHDG